MGELADGGVVDEACEGGEPGCVGDKGGDDAFFHGGEDGVGWGLPVWGFGGWWGGWFFRGHCFFFFLAGWGVCGLGLGGGELMGGCSGGAIEF